METISNTLFWISNGLLVPVVVLLLLFFLRAIILAGGFFGEFYQRMNLQKQFTETLENITPENIDGLLQQLPSAGNSPLLRNLSKLSAHRDDAAYCEHLLANYEMEAEKELGRSRTFIKLGPMLGLMGTPHPDGSRTGGAGTRRHLLHGLQYAGGFCHYSGRAGHCCCRRHYPASETTLVCPRNERLGISVQSDKPPNGRKGITD